MENGQFQFGGVKPLISLALIGLLAVACSDGISSSSRRSLRNAPSPAVSPTELEAEQHSPAPKKDTAEDKKEPRFASISKALVALRKHLDVPVILPAGVRSKAGLVRDQPVWFGRHMGKPAARLPLNIGKDELDIEYGVALFDGCGADMARPTSVGEIPALYLRLGRRHSGVRTDLIWPATRHNWAGRYGLSGTYRLRELLVMAESMEERAAEGELRDHGC